MTPEKDPPPGTLLTSFDLTPEELAETLPPEMLAPLTEEEIEVRREMEWAYNDPEVQQRYPDMIVAVYRRKVVAVGGDWGKVLEEAERATGSARQPHRRGRDHRAVDSRTLANGNVLPNIPIQEQRVDFISDQGQLARACRLVVGMEFFDRLRGKIQSTAILDTGAAFSVIPFSLWNGHNLSWKPFGSQLFTLQGQPQPDALKWLGVSCDFGVTQMALVDEANQATRPLRVQGKFVRSTLPARFENIILLGYSFLMDNSLTLTVNPASRASVGNLANVVGFLTLP